MKISCIDFETANGSRGSACSVGVAVIEDGVITLSVEKLIKPHASCRYFDPFNIAIHGIRPSDVADAPEFGELAPWLFDLLRADLVIAHNAAFDMSVLRALCDLYQMPYPEIQYFCTCKAASRQWPELVNHKLDTLCRHLNYQFAHHNAEADARAAGMLLLQLIQDAQARDAAELAARLQITFGVLTPGSYRPCSSRRGKK